MGSEYVLIPNDELYHWGIKGMKWGVRRYQNKDGSLTAAGKKRVAAEKNELKERERSIKAREKEKAERAKINAKKAELDARERELKGGIAAKLGKKNKASDTDSDSRVKSVSEMSNKELQEYTTRMRLEKEYYDAQRNLASITPKQVSKGQKFAETMMDNVVKPLAKDTATKFVDKALSKAFGNDEQDVLKVLKKEYETLKTKQDIDKLKNPDKYMSWEERTKKYNLEKNMEADKKAAEKSSNSSSDKGADSSKSKNDSQKKSGDSGSNNSKSDKAPKQEKKSSEKVYEGTVEGVGNSSKKNSSFNSAKSKNDTVIDADWYEVSVSNVPATTTNSGRSYIAGLLESSYRRDDD